MKKRRSMEDLTLEEGLRVQMKAELRKRMRGLRRAATREACVERSERICAALRDDPAFVAARRVALFWPIEDNKEIDLRPLDRELRARGAEVAYPAIDADTGAMRFVIVADPESELEERGLGFREPAPGTPDAGALDLIVVPALAVDPAGHRIGYGAGYYDRTLPRYAPPARTVAVVYDYQLLIEIPHGESDVAVDGVITDARVLRARDVAGAFAPLPL